MPSHRSNIDDGFTGEKKLGNERSAHVDNDENICAKYVFATIQSYCRGWFVDSFL
jgi:hypothetical protein